MLLFWMKQFNIKIMPEFFCPILSISCDDFRKQYKDLKHTGRCYFKLTLSVNTHNCMLQKQIVQWWRILQDFLHFVIPINFWNDPSAMTFVINVK